MSDPRVHDPAFGKLPVILYMVKCNGCKGTAREPTSSFDDLLVVNRNRGRGWPG